MKAILIMLKTTRHNNIKTDCFVDHPRIILVRKFSEVSLEEFTKDFLLAEGAGQEIIPIQIDSGGGSVDSLLGMIDIISRSKKKICTFTNTKACSAASVLLASGTPGYRFASKHSSLMVHEISAGTFGKQNEMMNDMEFFEALNIKLMNMLDSFCGHEKGFFKNKLFEHGNADLYFTAGQAVAIGLVDKVRSPSFEIEVSQKFKLY